MCFRYTFYALTDLSNNTITHFSFNPLLNFSNEIQLNSLLNYFLLQKCIQLTTKVTNHLVSNEIEIKIKSTAHVECEIMKAVLFLIAFIFLFILYILLISTIASQFLLNVCTFELMKQRILIMRLWINVRCRFFFSFHLFIK